MPRLRQPREVHTEELVDDVAEPTVYGVTPNSTDAGDQDSSKVNTGSDFVSTHEDDDDSDGDSDGDSPLKQQLDQLQKSESIQRNLAEKLARERDEAIRLAREREKELSSLRGDAIQSRQDAIDSAIAAAKAESEAAEKDMENAISLGDTKAQAEAYKKLARAEANLSKLEDGKAAIEEKRKESEALVQQRQQQQQTQTSTDPLENTNLPNKPKEWLRAHPNFLTDHRLNTRLQNAHYDLLDEGLSWEDDEYYEKLEERLGIKKSQRNNDGRDKNMSSDQGDQRQRSIVSAPVSRDIPTGGGPRHSSQLRLTPEQREAARISGISETEYAKQLTRLNQAKADGHYGEKR